MTNKVKNPKYSVHSIEEYNAFLKDSMAKYNENAPKINEAVLQDPTAKSKALDRVSLATQILLKRKNFYGNLILKMKREVTNNSKDAPASVYVHKNALYLKLNAFAVLNTSVEEVAKLLEHECLHPILEHFEYAINFKKIDLVKKYEELKKLYDSIGKDDSKNNRKERIRVAIELAKLKEMWSTFNIAGDIELNQHIEGIENTSFPFYDKESKSFKWSRGCSFDFYKELILDLQPNKSIDYYNKEVTDFLEYIKDDNQMGDEEYLEKLMEMLENMGSGGNDHSDMLSGDTGGDIVSEVLMREIRAAAKSSQRDSAGNIPGEVQKILENNSKSKVNWKKQLQNIVSSVRSFSQIATRMKRNRRYGLAYPGYRRDTSLHILACLDISGSCIDKSDNFIAELVKMHESGADITVAVGDTRITSVFKFDPKKPIDVTGGGGTEYQPFIDKACELNPDLLIILGDMGVFGENLTKPKCPVVWAITGRHERPANYGKSIYID